MNQNSESFPHKFGDFVLKRMLVTYLTLIPSFFLTIISLSFSSMVLFMVHVVLVLIGTFMMFRKYEEEKTREELLEEEKFTKKLKVFFEEFKGKISSSGYGYSLLNVAFRIASDEAVQRRTKAWTFHLHSLMDNMTSKSNLLDEKLKSLTTFLTVFEDFQNILFLLRDFRTAFYSMVEETKQDKAFGQDTDFEKQYKRLFEEYNNYMDRLRIFSDDLKVGFDLELSKEIVEHLKDFTALFPSGIIVKV